MAQGVETRTDARGRKRYRGVLNTSAAGKQRGRWGSFAEAQAWRRKALGEVEAGTRTATTSTLREEWDDFIAGAEAGTIHDRTGTPYKAATLRGYRRAWGRIDPALGAHRIGDVRRADIQAFVDRLAKEGHAAGTIRNTLDPLRTLYRRAIQRDRVAVNPTTNVDVPKTTTKRERVASREEAVALIAALPVGERALWGTAIYSGLWRGELRALRWQDVDLAGGIIAVSRSWDDDEGAQEPKTRAGNRRVPIVAPLRALLEEHAAAKGRAGADLVFGRTTTDPFIPTTARSRALSGWRKCDPPLTPITLHECRHTAASLMIAAGANAKALSVVLGHASIEITFNRYGHLMPGGVEEVGARLDTYLERRA